MFSCRRKMKPILSPDNNYGENNDDNKLQDIA